jgi:hypothetical protein
MGREVCVTVKNYCIPSGLSYKIHNAGSELYNIKGPMGKGLGLRRRGTHIGFSAGVGAIYFLDLVTHLARKHMGLLSPEEDKMLDDEFKFVFFTSFAN